MPKKDHSHRDDPYMDMTPELWYKDAGTLSIGPHGHTLCYKDIGDPSASSNDTLLLLHGFPESSYSYHRVVDGLQLRYKRLFLFDMIGYGQSTKPGSDTFGYSLMEQADMALLLWHSCGIKGGHLLAHDMGNSVATELIYRHVHQLLPLTFSEGFQSLTLTNGSIVLSMASLRITQKLLLHQMVGPWLSGMMRYEIFRQQVLSAHGCRDLAETDIKHMWLGNTYGDGHRKTHLTIRYILDRRRYETTRWLPSLKILDMPIHLCWGDQDQVARVEMAHYIQKHICPQARLTLLEGFGHFAQLDTKDGWVDAVLG